MPTYRIRPARERDLKAIVDIYNEEVLHGTATFDTDPFAVEERAPWFFAHDLGADAATGNHPLLVAVDEADKVVGYACLSEYRLKPGYAHTVELSVYVAHDARRRGVGRRLMDAVLELARNNPQVHMVLSLIVDGNAASIRMHEDVGFTRVGVTHETGYKFGRWYDDATYELRV